MAWFAHLNINIYKAVTFPDSEPADNLNLKVPLPAYCALLDILLAP